MNDDTIYAFASGLGRAAVGVFRLSGPMTGAVVKTIAGPLPPPRHARLVFFADPLTKERIDHGLVLWFPGPASFTGEDAAEFHIHGGLAVLEAMVQAFGKIEGLRPAKAGEFTRRAFANGKLDLSAVEGLADLIEAETEAQRRQALRHVSGKLRDQALIWRAVLLEASALIEGEIDFADEGDVPKGVTERLVQLLSPILAALKQELASAKAGERIRDGLTIVIAGPPNAGKSTLLNALARRDVAIVSEHAGTTRDLLEVRLNIEGLAVTLIDTAGLRESIDPVEEIGVARARKRAEDADLILWLSEAGKPELPDPGLLQKVLWPILTKSDKLELLPELDPHPEEQAQLASRDGRLFETAATPPPQGEAELKLDRYSPHPEEPLKAASRRIEESPLSISAATGENLDVLIERLASFAKSATLNGEAGLISRERHRLAFAVAAAGLERIIADPMRPIEFLAEDLRLAMRALESLIGGVDVEDILGEIFSRFCVGK